MLCIASKDEGVKPNLIYFQKARHQIFAPIRQTNWSGTQIVYYTLIYCPLSIEILMMKEDANVVIVGACLLAMAAVIQLRSALLRMYLQNVPN